MVKFPIDMLSIELYVVEIDDSRFGGFSCRVHSYTSRITPESSDEIRANLKNYSGVEKVTLKFSGELKSNWRIVPGQK